MSQLRNLEEMMALDGSPGRRGPATGYIVGVTPDGVPLIEVADTQGEPLPARNTVPGLGRLLPELIAHHQEVLLAFLDGDAGRPVITGVLQPDEVTQGVPGSTRIEGEDEVVLSCGEASITLRRNGRVVIRGTHLESDSLGANWIRGADIQVG
jgi:hypothetical protein